MTLQTRHALSVDLEEYFQVSNFEGVLDRSRWDDQPSRITAATHRLLALFDETASRATFFCLGWVAERQPALMREIQRRGHEIACHGHGHELVYELGPARFRADVRRARAVIEDVVGAPVRGYRAPSYSITERSLWALPILAEEGFDYDSSIFPIRHPRYGFPGFSERPVRVDLGDGASLREFPPTTLRVGPLRIPLSGGAYLRFLPAALFRLGFARLARRGEATVLYVHPWECDPEQPRQRVPLRIRVNHYYNLSRTLPRLRSLLQPFAFAPLGEVLDGLEAAGELPRYAVETRGPQL